NYKIWNAAITIATHTKNKLGFLNEKLKRPKEEGFMQEQFDRCNSVVLNWILGCVSQDVFIGQVFSKNAKHYYKFNALWRQYDSLVNLLDCICENSEKLKKHNQLLKLMQFLIGLDEDESHRSNQSHNVSKTSNDNTAFVARTNPKNNNWSGSSNQPIKLNRPNLVCTHCNMNGHTTDRCFELVGYPPNFKRNTSTNRGSTSNNDVSGIKDRSTGSSKSFTDD
ncbi:hypothetical protein Tco_1374829, partial [Tanacetum coccineum]